MRTPTVLVVVVAVVLQTQASTASEPSSWPSSWPSTWPDGSWWSNGGTGGAHSVIEAGVCTPVEIVRGFSVDACTLLSFDTCEETLTVSATVAGEEVIDPVIVTADDKQCGSFSASGLSCEFCMDLDDGAQISTSGIKGCFSVDMTCGGFTIPFSNECFEVGKPFECEADNCTDCVSREGCGWCLATESCMPGSSDEPQCAQCDGSEVACGWFYDGCPTYTGVCPACNIDPPDCEPEYPSSSWPYEGCVSPNDIQNDVKFCSSYLPAKVSLPPGTFPSVLDNFARTYHTALLATGNGCSNNAQIEAAKQLSCLSVFTACHGGDDVSMCQQVCRDLYAKLSPQASLAPCDGDTTHVCELTESFSSVEGESCMDASGRMVENTWSSPSTWTSTGNSATGSATSGHALTTAGTTGANTNAPPNDSDKKWMVASIAVFTVVVVGGIGFYVYKKRGNELDMMRLDEVSESEGSGELRQRRTSLLDRSGHSDELERGTIQ